MHGESSLSGEKGLLQGENEVIQMMSGSSQERQQDGDRRAHARLLTFVTWMPRFGRSDVATKPGMVIRRFFPLRRPGPWQASP